MIRRGPDKRPRAKRGEVQIWLRNALASKTDACLIWPFSCVGIAGKPQPQATVNGSRVNVCNFVCRMAHGSPPPDKHHAAHKCGNRLCVNKRHLRWASAIENETDKIGHGTKTFGERMHNAKLTERDVRRIRNSSASNSELARRFRVSRQTINSARTGRSWQYLA